jgi:UDP-2,4-diacetamido-2,4,6-trideoxy-beta-L-altropyranose hydrolase
MKNFVFRVDASLQIGTGHVMRCLTLADALSACGEYCQFICRDHAGNLIEFIRNKGYAVHISAVAPLSFDSSQANQAASAGQGLLHGNWLGTTQTEDAQACADLLAKLRPDWLIVDHYALDARWEQAVKPHCTKLMVIDDLADRPHLCDLLLDQTFGCAPEEYRALVPDGCRLLCGSQYALLRPEFAALRPYSLHRRTQPSLRKLLVTMGGVDKDNATGQVLKALRTCALPPDCHITVIMGPHAPWVEAVTQQAQTMPLPTSVLTGVGDMARLMADSDLAIGAAGATSWERCCLGLPTIMLPLAENQVQSCHTLSETGAGLMILGLEVLGAQLPQILRMLSQKSDALSQITAISSSITDGRGTERVAKLISV